MASIEKYMRGWDCDDDPIYLSFELSWSQKNTIRKQVDAVGDQLLSKAGKFNVAQDSIPRYCKNANQVSGREVLIYSFSKNQIREMSKSCNENWRG